MRFEPRTWSLALCFSVVPVSSVLAQVPDDSSAMTGRVPVLVLQYTESAPGRSSPVIVRRVAGSPRDIIVLPFNADAQALASALFMLTAARSASGDTASRAARIRVPILAAPNPFGEREQIKMIRALNRLALTTPRQVEGIGVVRSAVLQLLPARKMTSSQ